MKLEDLAGLTIKSISHCGIEFRMELSDGTVVTHPDSWIVGDEQEPLMMNLNKFHIESGSGQLELPLDE